MANDPWRVRADLTRRDGPDADQPADRCPAQLQGRGCFVERGLSAFRPFTLCRLPAISETGSKGRVFFSLNLRLTMLQSQNNVILETEPGHFPPLLNLAVECPIFNPNTPQVPHIVAINGSVFASGRKYEQSMGKPQSGKGPAPQR